MQNSAYGGHLLEPVRWFPNALRSPDMEWPLKQTSRYDELRVDEVPHVLLICPRARQGVGQRRVHTLQMAQSQYLAPVLSASVPSSSPAQRDLLN